MNLPKHPRTLLVIIAEAALEKSLARDVRRLGAHGYTVYDVRGAGHSGIREGSWEADRSIEMKVICEAEVADRIAAHVLGCWLMLGVLALELRYGLMLLAEHYNAWRWLGWAVLPSAFLLAMAAPRAWPWPVAAYPREYRVLAAAPLALLMLGWLWLANIASDGSADPLAYLPLLNPLELGMLLVLLAIYTWLRGGLPQLGLAAHGERIAQTVAGASLFVVLTASVFRAAHHWGGVPYELDALLDSMLVQAGLSIVWTLIALPLMIVGHLRGRRELWLLGAVLIAVVVAKLFFVELGNRGGLERIISFIGVGVLLLVVGYFAPLPPRKAEPEQVNA